MEKFKYPAKVTHSTYGSIRYPAGFDISWNRLVVFKISSHNSTSQTNANRYSSRLKKIIDQKKLNISWIPYTVRAVLFGFLDVSTRYDAIPIRIYRIVQTTGNSHPGGARTGLLIDSKVSILFRVRSADKLPTASGMARQVIRFFNWIFKKSPP